MTCDPSIVDLLIWFVVAAVIFGAGYFAGTEVRKRPPRPPI